MPVIIPQEIKNKYTSGVIVPEGIKDKYKTNLIREQKLEKVYEEKPYLRPEKKKPISFRALMGFEKEEKPFDVKSELDRSIRLTKELGQAFKKTYKELPKGIVDTARGIVHAGIEFPASFALNLAQLTGVSKTGRIKIPAIGEIRSLNEQYEDWKKIARGNEAIAALGFGSENLLKLAIFSSWTGYRSVATITNSMNKAEQLAFKQLGIKQGADLKTITTAFRKQAAIFHPDKWAGKSGAKNAATKFKEINNAYNFLKGIQGVSYKTILKAQQEINLGKVVKKAQETKLPVALTKKLKIEPVIAPKVEVKPIPKELEPLAVEARKYKSVEEFVSSQQKLYRGGETLDLRQVGNRGIPLTTEKRVAQRFLKAKEDFRKGLPFLDIKKVGLEEYYISPIAKIATKNDIPIELFQKYKSANPVLYPEKAEPILGGWAKENGFDAIDYRTLGKTSAKEAEIKVLNPNVIKNKSQLTDFYNQAVKEVKPEIKPVVTPTELPIDPVEKILTVLKEAKPIRGVQETLFAKERGKRLAEALRVGEKVKGEKGFYAELAQLKGKLPKVQFETIRGQISQGDIDSLFIRVQESRALNEWDKLPARMALSKLFGETGVKLPTEGEIVLLNRVFGEEFTKVLISKQSLMVKWKKLGLDIANVPRSLMASYDVSAPLRQGLFLIRRPEFYRANEQMFKYLVSEKAFERLAEEIAQRPTYQMMTDSKLALTEIGNVLSQREEAFMSKMAEKIPVVGKGVRASERAYVGFLNKLRADTFDNMVARAEKLGLNPKNDLDLTKSIAKYINNATGRGDLGVLEKNAVALNTMLFSPRLMASRLRLLNPIFYIKLHPFVRKQALKDLFAVTGLILTTLTLAQFAGADVEGDPTSSDFGKIKIRKTRFDIMGGFQQYIKTAAQLITGKVKSSTTGRTIKLGEGYKPMTRLSVLGRALEYKEAPIMSFITNWLRGATPFGEEFKISNEVIQRFIPMVIQDIIDIAKEEPELLPFSILGMFGVGIQTYK